MICNLSELLCITSIFTYVLCHEFVYRKTFDDRTSYGIKWVGGDKNFMIPGDSEPMTVVTSNKERYQCYIPLIIPNKPEYSADYNGPNPLDLLAPLFAQSSCTYRLESYWTYQLCHGKFVKQYHEEREGKKVKSQEYFLGKWNKETQAELVEYLNTAKQSNERVKTTKIDHVQLPYLEILMTDGTVCDLNNKPRLTRVRYVCHIEGKHDIYTLKETSTCEYEMIVRTPLLCVHPSYKSNMSGEHTIGCVPEPGFHVAPIDLVKMEMESHREREKRHKENRLAKDVVAVFKVEKQKSGESRVRVEIHPVDLEDKSGIGAQLPEGPRDTSVVEAFLAGHNCLTGGSGWWKYEFCYGRTVEQFHVEPDGRRTSVLLGKYNEVAHKAWIEDNPHKKPKPQGERASLSHFYSGGTECEKTNKPRQTEVKLKCLENSSSPSAVSLYLLEPKTCEYILGVESPLICDILQKADSYGLVKENIDLISEVHDDSGKDKVETKGDYAEDFEIRFEND